MGRALAAFFARAGLACFVAIVVPVMVAADPVADFYRGKQIRVVIRAAPGGNYDLYSRLLVRHMIRFIPGQPSALPVNTPGGSGLTALAYVAAVHPRDGTVLTMVTQSFPLEQALGINDKLKTDMRSLNWIGNMSDASNFLLTSAKEDATAPQ
jgi:tripartite-type tricarboxylate transporter receptor subunit TctC